MTLSRWKIMAAGLGVSLGGLAAVAGQCPKDVTKGGPVALCVLTEDNEDRRYDPDNAGNRLCAEVARAVYDYFDPKAGAAGGGPDDR